MASLPIHFDRHISIHIEPESEESINNAKRELDTIERGIQELQATLQPLISDISRRNILAAGWEEYEHGMYRPGPELSNKLYEYTKKLHTDPPEDLLRLQAEIDNAIQQHRAQQHRAPETHVL